LDDGARCRDGHDQIGDIKERKKENKATDHGNQISVLTQIGDLLPLS
jgi:hypothetical protein